MILATGTGLYPVDSIAAEIDRVARLAHALLHEHSDDAGRCATCPDTPFPCGPAVLAEQAAALGST